MSFRFFFLSKILHCMHVSITLLVLKKGIISEDFIIIIRTSVVCTSQNFREPGAVVGKWCFSNWKACKHSLWDNFFGVGEGPEVKLAQFPQQYVWKILFLPKLVEGGGGYWSLLALGWYTCVSIYHSWFHSCFVVSYVAMVKISNASKSYKKYPSKVP